VDGPARSLRTLANGRADPHDLVILTAEPGNFAARGARPALITFEHAGRLTELCGDVAHERTDLALIQPGGGHHERDL
jgi:hypothetical protein